ncbi:hypothetical protein D3C77_660660 [compost metagenome]
MMKFVVSLILLFFLPTTFADEIVLKGLVNKPIIHLAASCTGTAERECIGVYGDRCFKPAYGEQCYRGYVCGMDQKFCESLNGRISCYSPAKGETCP